MLPFHVIQAKKNCQTFKPRPKCSGCLIIPSSSSSPCFETCFILDKTWFKPSQMMLDHPWLCWVGIAGSMGGTLGKFPAFADSQTPRSIENPVLVWGWWTPSCHSDRSGKTPCNFEPHRREGDYQWSMVTVCGVSAYFADMIILSACDVHEKPPW